MEHSQFCVWIDAVCSFTKTAKFAIMKPYKRVTQQGPEIYTMGPGSYIDSFSFLLSTFHNVLNHTDSGRCGFLLLIKFQSGYSSCEYDGVISDLQYGQIGVWSDGNIICGVLYFPRIKISCSYRKVQYMICILLPEKHWIMVLMDRFDKYDVNIPRWKDKLLNMKLKNTITSNEFCACIP